MAGMRIGFIGLGALGGAIATRLQAAGHELRIWGRKLDTLAAWRDAGAQVMASPAELAAQCDCVILCVTDTAAVEHVVFGDNGVASAARADSVLLDHSTIHPLATCAFATRLHDRCAMQWLDAPVSGGVTGAREGRLVVMAGGDGEVLDRVRPLLAAYSQRVTHMGGSGAGQATKIANQMMIGGNVAVAAEALNYAANFGVAAARLPDALAGGWADSAVLQHHARRMAAADYTGEVSATIMVKDLDIASDLGRETVSPMPVTALVQQLYRQLIAQGDADKGQSGLMWLYKQRALDEDA
jgi:3-hydroxyisobutyrate dehydrogenase